MVFYKKLNDYQDKFFNFIIIILYLLIFSSFLGIFDNAIDYFNDVDYYFKIYICLFLIWRFNPFRDVNTFTHLDRKIAFNAGILIFTTTVLQSYIPYITDKIKKNKIVNYIKTSSNKLLNSY
jgi:hypothetical protein